MDRRWILILSGVLLSSGFQAGWVHAEPARGCSNSDPGISGIYSMMDQGVLRHYRVYLPGESAEGKPSKLLLFFHGWGGDENEVLRSPKVRALAQERNTIMVTPRGLGGDTPDSKSNSWSFSGSNTGLDGDGLNSGVAGDTAAICDDQLTPDYLYPSCAESATNHCAWTHCQADDKAFTKALLEELAANFCFDTDTIFASGGSNGGMFVWELGQDPQTAQLFRAIAPIIGLPHRGYLAGPGREGEFPVLLITGLLDDVVPPGNWDDPSYTTTSNDNDRFYYTGASAITAAWASAQGCDTSRPAGKFDVGVEQVDCRSHCPASDSWPLVMDCRSVMGHQYGLDWSFELMLDFFEARTLP